MEAKIAITLKMQVIMTVIIILAVGKPPSIPKYRGGFGSQLPRPKLN